MSPLASGQWEAADRLSPFENRAEKDLYPENDVTSLSRLESDVTYLSRLEDPLEEDLYPEIGEDLDDEKDKQDDLTILRLKENTTWQKKTNARQVSFLIEESRDVPVPPLYTVEAAGLRRNTENSGNSGNSRNVENPANPRKSENWDLTSCPAAAETSEKPKVRDSGKSVLKTRETSPTETTKYDGFKKTLWSSHTPPLSPLSPSSPLSPAGFAGRAGGFRLKYDFTPLASGAGRLASGKKIFLRRTSPPL